LKAQQDKKAQLEIRRKANALAKAEKKLGERVKAKNRSFPSIREACRYYAIPESTFRKRKQKGYSVEQCLGLLPIKKPFKVKGLTFSGIKEACGYYNVNVATFRNRRKRGFSIEQSLGLEEIPRKRSIPKPHVSPEKIEAEYDKYRDQAKVSKSVFISRKQQGYSVDQCLGLEEVPKITVEGVEYYTYTDLAKAYGVRLSAISKARARGKKGDDVIPEYKRKSYVWFEHKGKKFKSRKEACKYYNVTESAFVNAKKKGYSMEQCLGLKEGYYFFVKGKRFSSETSAVRYFNANEHTYRFNKEKGYSIEQCLGLEEISHKGWSIKGKSFEVEGKEFKSYTQACRHYNVKIGTFHNRKRKGYSIEQCLGLKEVPDNRYSSERKV
jgi:hypothetical protein|tara:strand:+ start:722 stop:1867 length:1146 start_codon:yes stop_codon:yes gene_type:complete